MERHAGFFEALGRPTAHQHDSSDGHHHTADKRPEAIGRQGRRHVQATVADKEGVEEIVTLARPRHGQEHREVPEQDLQQGRDIAENFHIDRGQLADDPVRREPGDADDKAQQGRQNDTDKGHQEGVEQADDEHPGIAVRLGVIDQVLGDAEAGTALEKAEAGGDAPVLEIGLGVVKQVPAQRDHRHNGDDLKYPPTHTWIA
ncbi:hypothetical protein D3C85_1150970 [compost metagenome]